MYINSRLQCQPEGSDKDMDWLTQHIFLTMAIPKRTCMGNNNVDYASVGGAPEAYGSRRVFVSE